MEINYNTLLDKAIDTLSRLPYLEDTRLLNIYFNVIVAVDNSALSKENSVDVNKLYTFLKLFLVKLDDVNRIEKKHKQLILNHLVANRHSVGDETLFFDVIKLLLLKENSDDQGFINIISFIILKVVFVYKAVPGEAALRFLETRIVDEIAETQLALMAPGLLTNLIKIMKLDLKHSMIVFELSLDILSKLLLKIQSSLSSNEKVLVYQSIEGLFKTWSATVLPTNSKINNVIIDHFCKPLAQFQLLNELVCMEYMFRAQEITQKQATYFEKDQIVFILANKVKMIDVFYFDSKTYTLFANGLKILSFYTDCCELGTIFKRFIDATVDSKDSAEFKNKSTKDTSLPDFINFDQLVAKDSLQDTEAFISINVASDSELHEAVIEKYVPIDIREKWVHLVSLWAKILDKQLVLDLVEMSDIDERKQALCYYVLFQIENFSGGVDELLLFEDDSDIEDDHMLDHFIELVDSPNEKLPMSSLYFINNFISGAKLSDDLKEMEVDLIPILLTNISNPLAQYILKNLSLSLYPSASLGASFKSLIQQNTDVILSHLTTYIVASGSGPQKHWITFTKSVFEVCGIDLVRKAGDVLNLMFQVMAVSSISSRQMKIAEDLNSQVIDGADENVQEVMAFFSVVLDLILNEYGALCAEPSVGGNKRMCLEDVIELFRNNDMSDNDNDDDDVEEEISATNSAEVVPVASHDGASFDGVVPQQTYKLVIEIMGYIERCFPMLQNKNIAIKNIGAVLSIMRLNEKSFKPQLAQTIWPLLEKYLGKELPGKSAGAVDLVTRIIALEPQFMFHRIKDFFIASLKHDLSGESSGYTAALERLGHVIMSLSRNGSRGVTCSDVELLWISAFLKRQCAPRISLSK